MLNPAKAARVPGSHFVSPLDFDPEVLAQYDFPTPLRLIDSTLRKTHFTAGHTTTRLGYQKIAAALVDLGVRDESINISWAGSAEPSPQDWALLEAIVEGGFDFRLNVYTDTLLGDGRHYQPVSMKHTVDLLVAAGVEVAAPGIVPAADEVAQGQQIADLEAYFDYAGQAGLDTTITLANVGRRDFHQMLTMANHAVALGARRLDLMDSTSSLTPEAMKVFIRRFRAALITPVPLTMHSHDEFGLATACAIAAATVGASPDVSMNGMSYRAGFAPLEQVVLALEVLYGVDTGINTERITAVSQVVARESGVPIPPSKPLTGSYAYLKHMPGDAAAAIREGQNSFPPISHGLVPAKMGQRVTWVWGGASSDAMVTELARSLDAEVNAAEAAVLRRAMDHAVAQKSSYPRWLEPGEAAARFTALLAGLRIPRTAEERQAALNLACPYRPWIERVLDRSGVDTTAAVIEAARAQILALDGEDVVSMAALFSPLGSDADAGDARSQLSQREEAGLAAGGPSVAGKIRDLAAEYQEVHGFAYVVSASGLGPDDVLARLGTRLRSGRRTELRTTAREIASIVDNRLISHLASSSKGKP